MDATTAFAAAFVATAAAAILGRLVGRARAATGRERPVVDAAAWKRTRDRRRAPYGEFATAADWIAIIAGLRPAIPAASRLKPRDQALEHLQDLERQLNAVLLEGGPGVQAAARQLDDECTRLVDGLDLDAESGPADTDTAGLAAPFHRDCRAYLDAESERHFGLRPAGRSLLARLSTR